MENINEAILNISKKKKLKIIEFTIFADEEKLNHCWYIAADKEKKASKLAEILDKELSMLNDDYKSARKHILGKPKVKILKESTFYTYLNSQGKIGAQNKFPRVLNKEQSKKWRTFIKSI